MTLGDRCDEIVRMIDDTLDSLRTPRPLRRRGGDPTSGASTTDRPAPPEPGPRAA
jgi:hypothetical protein